MQGPRWQAADGKDATQKAKKKDGPAAQKTKSLATQPAFFLVILPSCPLAPVIVFVRIFRPGRMASSLMQATLLASRRALPPAFFYPFFFLPCLFFFLSFFSFVDAVPRFVFQGTPCVVGYLASLRARHGLLSFAFINHIAIVDAKE